MAKNNSLAILEASGGRTQITNILNTAQPQVSGNITIQRPAQITLATTLPVVAQNIPSGTTYHVPRGPAVVANLAAPRSNVGAAIRAPMVVTAQTTGQVKYFCLISMQENFQCNADLIR